MANKMSLIKAQNRLTVPKSKLSKHFISDTRQYISLNIMDVVCFTELIKQRAKTFEEYLMRLNIVAQNLKKVRHKVEVIK